MLVLPRSRMVLAVRFQGIEAGQFFVRLCQ
jgi:hypothetical protein